MELLGVPVEENILIRLSLKKNLMRLNFGFKAIRLTVSSRKRRYSPFLPLVASNLLFMYVIYMTDMCTCLTIFSQK